MTFNKEKTGSVTAGKASNTDSRLPEGDVRWGFLRLNNEGFFEIDQAIIDEHIIELRRQLDATNSLFAWTQAYNKYMSFIVRNCASPAYVYGLKHLDSIIDTLTRVQKETFKESGDGVEDACYVDFVSQQLAKRFDVNPADIPRGMVPLANAAGGLEVKDPLVDLFLVRKALKKRDNTAELILQKARLKDEEEYKNAKHKWEEGTTNRHRRVQHSDYVDKNEGFFSKEEFDKGPRRSCCVVA